MDWSKVSDQLSKPLDPKNVVKPTGQYGPKGDYLYAWHVINEANRIFGFGGWSYTSSLQKVCEATNEKGNIEIGFICTCTVTVDGVTRQDVGYGSGAAKKVGDAYEGAVKEAATDALKRCLRTFGNVFGLALYDANRANVAAPAPAVVTPETKRDWFKAQMAKADTQEKLNAWWTGEKIAAGVAALPEHIRDELSAEYNRLFDAMAPVKDKVDDLDGDEIPF